MKEEGVASNVEVACFGLLIFVVICFFFVDQAYRCFCSKPLIGGWHGR